MCRNETHDPLLSGGSGRSGDNKRGRGRGREAADSNKGRGGGGGGERGRGRGGFEQYKLRREYDERAAQRGEERPRRGGGESNRGQPRDGGRGRGGARREEEEGGGGGRRGGTQGRNLQDRSGIMRPEDLRKGVRKFFFFAISCLLKKNFRRTFILVMTYFCEFCLLYRTRMKSIKLITRGGGGGVKTCETSNCSSLLLWIRNDFSAPDPDQTLKVVPDPDPA
jgi:hypothetical protein